jgi:hypothetical protein
MRAKWGMYWRGTDWVIDFSMESTNVIPRCVKTKYRVLGTHGTKDTVLAVEQI